MKLSSASVAKLLLVLSIAIATVSAWKGLDWHRKTESLSSQLRIAKEDERKAREEFARLSDVLPKESQALPLTPTLLSLVNTLNKGQLTHRIQLNSLAPQVVTSNTNLDLNEFSQPVGNTELRSFVLQVKGNYREYSGLRAYLKLIATHPAAITRIVIAGSSFELDIKVYGTLT